MYERSRRTVLKENVSPRTQSLSPSICMVVRGGTIPASLSSFPGMEHDRSIFNGLSQETTSNGISQFTETFEEKPEIEIAVVLSETETKPSLFSPPRSPTSAMTPAAEPVSSDIIPFPAATIVSSSQTLPPLHINVNDCSKPESITAHSRNPELSSNGSISLKKMLQQPSLKIPQRASTSTDPSPIIMGPPSSTNTQVLLSPAGNFQNGYQRKSSGDFSPSSNRYIQRTKRNNSPHPLAIQRASQSVHRANNAPPVTQISRPSSSLASPQSNGRKDHEMTRRRALVDRITKSRGPEYVHLLPQTENLSHTQTSILLRKHRGTLIAEGMPYSLQTLIDCGAERDITDKLFVERIKEAKHKRARHNNTDELTDVSDLEDDFEELKTDSTGRKSPKNIPRWTPKRMRYSGMLSRAETLLDEKTALLKMLDSQHIVMDSSSGVRFEGEEIIPRRRRQLNGMYFLYDKTRFRRKSPTQFGCSRARPIQSWTKRYLKPDVFDYSESAFEKPGPGVVKPSLYPVEKWIATAQTNTISYLTNGEKREITEYAYEEYKAGEGAQRVNELSSIDPMEFVISSDFSPFDDRQMSYMYRLSTAPSSVIRKKHGKSIHFEIDDRKHSNRNAAEKRKTDKKKERKPVEEGSSGEEDVEEEEAKAPAKKRPRGRPVTSKRKTSRMSMASRMNNGIYVDYLFDDYLNDNDYCSKQIPNKITYASIAVPHWCKIQENYWDDVPRSKADADGLLISVAKEHHKLMHAERERIRRETDKRIRNRQAAAVNQPGDGTDADGFPLFDMRQFEPNIITSRRIYASVEKPYEQRDFLNNHNSESTT